MRNMLTNLHRLLRRFMFTPSMQCIEPPVCCEHSLYRQRQQSQPSSLPPLPKNPFPPPNPSTCAITNHIGARWCRNFCIVIIKLLNLLFQVALQQDLPRRDTSGRQKKGSLQNNCLTTLRYSSGSGRVTRPAIKDNRRLLLV